MEGPTMTTTLEASKSAISKKKGSRYNISVPLKEGRRLVFNSMTMAMAVWDQADVVAYDALIAGEEIEYAHFVDLMKGGFIVAEEIDEVAGLKAIYDRHRFDESNLMLTIAPTMACNFGCDYCFQGADKPHATMSQEVQDAIIALVERAAPNGVKSVGVTWYGGEPLLRLNIIEALSDRMIEVCNRTGMKYHASVVTNGYKLTEEAARSLHKRGVTWIQITLDGTPEYHDTRRYLLGGKGSFEKIIDNLRAIVDVVPIAYTIRVNIDSRNFNDIHTLIDYLAEQGLARRRNLNMYFAPVEATTEGCHEVKDVTMTKNSYGQLETELFEHGMRVGLTGAPQAPRFHGTCGAVRPSALVILPTGDLHKCWDTVSWPERRVGSIFKLEELKENALNIKWLAWTPFENHTCKNCKLLPNCSGACAYKFIHSDVTRGEAAVLPCPSWKYNIKERLVQRAVARGTLKREDYDSVEIRTIPSELCADDVIEGGLDLPSSEMEKYYTEQKKIRLPVLQGQRGGI